MDNVKEVIATFRGQVKSCRDRQSQWKSGCVKISPSEDGGLCVLMFLNVMPNQVYSQINVPSSGISVKSNRVVIEDAKGPGMYVRLSGAREADESRRIISQMVVHEAPRRSKAEVGKNEGLKLVKTPLKTPPSSLMKQSTPALSWSKIASPKSVTKSGDSNNSYGSATLNGWRSVNQLKRHSLEMEEGDIDKLYNDENQDKPTEYTRFRKTSPSSENKDLIQLNNLKANNFYGKSGLMSPGLHIKSPRSRVRDQATSSASRSLYAAMQSVQESPTKKDAEECKEVVPVPRIAPKSPTETEAQAEHTIVGFDNLGNTCFINSPLQCLAYLEPLSLDIQAVVQKYGKRLRPGSVIRLLYLLMKDVRKTGANVSPERVKLILMRLRRVMDGKFEANTQQDAHELLSEILDRCDEEVKGLLRLEGLEQGGPDGSGGGDVGAELKPQQALSEELLNSIPNPTSRNFNSYFKNTFQFQTCKNRTVSQEEHDTTMMLALTSHPDGLHLQDCVDNYFKGCEVEMKCDACKHNEKATITRKIVKRPRCLILNLLRYSTDNMDAKKKMDRVTIPRYISIADFCSDDAKPPAHIAPAFLADRLVYSSSGRTSDQDAHTSPSSKPESSEADKGSSEALQGTSVTSNNADTDNLTAEGAMKDDHAVSGNDSALNRSLNTSVDDDSDFGQSNATSTTTTTSTTFSTTATAESTSTMSVCESLNAEPCQETDSKDIGVEDSTSDNEAISNNLTTSIDHNDNYDDGVVTFKNIPTLTAQTSSERLKCLGGAEMSESSVECVGKLDQEDEATGGILKFHRGKSVSVKVKDESSSCESVTIEGVEEVIDDRADFVPVGEVHVKEAVRIGDDVGNETAGGETRSEELNTWSDRLKDDIHKPTFKAGSIFNHFSSCLEVKVDGDLVEGNNNNLNNLMNNNNSDVVKNQMRLAESLEEEIMDTEDMGTQMVCGRNIHEYTEAELVSLDVGALTEYEMLLYAQELSRIEYEKEKREREKAKERLERQLFESINDDFVYDESFLEEAESLLKSTSSVTSFGNVSPCKALGNKKRNVEERESSSASLDDGVCSMDNSFTGVTGLDDSSGRTRRVPDILQNVGDDGLLCHENLSEDEEMSNLRGLKMSVPTVGETTPSKEKRKKNTVTSSSAGLDNFWEPQNGATNGILSDKNQQISPAVSTTDWKQAVEFSKKVSESQSPARRVVVNSPNYSSSDSEKDLPPFIDRPSPHSLSPFTKPVSDLCIVSPSKNRNLVKTRDYSRLRSPSASPKKRTKSSPMANSVIQSPSTAKKGSASKHLKFSDDIKYIKPDPWGESLEKPWSENRNSSSRDKNGIQSTSRALIFGEDEPDSMNFHNGNSDNIETDDRVSWTPFQRSGVSTTSTISTSALFSTATTSTPIMSETVAPSSGKPNLSPNQFSSISTSLKNKPEISPSSKSLEIRDASVDACARTSRDSNNGTGVIEKESEMKYDACAPVQDGSARRKINRSLASSFTAAEGKENSENTVEIAQERQARRKRIYQIEQGEADNSYRLVGIINHHGESLFAGHYTCSSYNLHKQRWYRMDDRHTEETTDWTVRRDSSTTGYVFFYMDKELFESYSRERARQATSSNKSPSAKEG